MQGGQTMQKKVAILGSTGSIGTQALDVIRLHHLTVTALAANSNVDLLEKQVREFMPEKVCIYDESCYTNLKTRLADLPCTIVTGMDGLCEIAADTTADICLNAVVGMVGLLPTLTAIRAGVDVALANKETLVAGGSLVMAAAKKYGVTIYPVDSEHSAIFQCLQGNRLDQVHGIILTASGGPFYGKKREELKDITPADALKHPNWNMGNKVTIDSSTLMNKGLEVIEAKWLFDLEPDQIEVVIHRQSILHSAVVYNDTSVIAQLGVPDMRLPIQYALLYPDRCTCPSRHLSLTQMGTLTFEQPDLETFSCLKIAMTAMVRGGTSPAVMNAANEVAVAAFLQGKIGYLQIGDIVEKVFAETVTKQINRYEDVLEADREARESALMSL